MPPFCSMHSIATGYCEFSAAKCSAVLPLSRETMLTRAEDSSRWLISMADLLFFAASIKGV